MGKLENGLNGQAASREIGQASLPSHFLSVDIGIFISISGSSHITPIFLFPSQNKFQYPHPKQVLFAHTSKDEIEIFVSRYGLFKYSLSLKKINMPFLEAQVKSHLLLTFHKFVNFITGILFGFNNFNDSI